jgi:AraC-like DNA-binding protein
MHEFYKKALLAFIFLVVADALVACMLVYQSYLSLSLLPAKNEDARWHYDTYTDVATGGSSTVRMHDGSRERMRFDFRVTNQDHFPFASAQLMFDDGKGKLAHVDWSKYATVTFLAKCVPANSMFLGISTLDEKFSKPGDFLTYRSPGTYFSCTEQGVSVSLDLNRFTQPDWWFAAMKVELSQQAYKLDHVAKMLFGTSGNSPRNRDSYLEISELTLHGRDYRYLVALAIVIVSSLTIFAIWFFLAHTRALTASMDSKMKKDLPLMAYRQLTLEPYKDKEKVSILRFIATNYTDPELDLERVMNETGVNRNKVNEVLKSELDMTFTSYLNKLRLTESARLLAEASSAAVAEIAYSVGYANVSYFNKLFKEEYGCTPKAFRSIAKQQAPASPPLASPVDASA